MRRSRTNSCRRVVLAVLLVVAAGWAEKTSPASLALARAQISRGQLETAEKTVWGVLSSDPNQSEALTLLGIIRGEQKRYSEAEAVLKRAIQLDPKSLVARKNLASALLAEDKQDEALDVYREIVKTAPWDTAAKVELSRLYVARGQFKDALDTLNGVPAGKLPVEAIPAKAAALLGDGNRQEAGELIEQVKNSPVLTADLAEVYLGGNAPDLALKAANSGIAVSKRPSNRLLYLKGRALQATGDDAGAAKAFADVLARDPKSAETLVAMAGVEASKGQHGESVKLLKRAYEIQPEAPSVLRPLIVEAVKAGQPKTALIAAHALANKSPDSFEDQYLAAAAMLEGEDFASAAESFQRCVAQRSDSKSYLGLGMAELAQQHFAESRAALEQALKIDPGSADAEYELGALAESQGDGGGAMNHFERAVQLQPQHAKALAGLGEHYLQGGDLERAHSVLEQSVASDPNNPKSQYNLALVLSKLGKTQEAEQHMQRSRDLNKEEDRRKNPVPVATKD